MNISLLSESNESYHMKISFRFPAQKPLYSWLEQRKKERHAYSEVGASRNEKFPAGYDHDRNEVCIGQGRVDFEAGVEALKHWKMFPASWTKVSPSPMEWEAGKEVAVMFRLFGLWWWNSCRIVYVLDEPDKKGFAYGTLKSHVEKGEEIFFVEMEPDGSVWYRIQAFSQPNFILTKLFKPVARFYQRKFVKGSTTGMVEALQKEDQTQKKAAFI